ncbi:MAG: glycosyltransferase [Steroidobacteraceae bacterium]
MPIRAEGFHDWLSAHTHVADGKYTWTLLTYLRLKDAGFPCKLVTHFPRAGIVVSHRDFLPVFLAPRRNVFLVCIKADRNPHPWADYHVVQNPYDALMQPGAPSRHAVDLPHWPQPNLIVRDPARATVCTNVAYFGRRLNLAPEFLEDNWSATLRTHGFQWNLRPRNQWHDYSQVDVTLSVRDWRLDHSRLDPVLRADSKPPSKLVNSWLAGVPALAGPESAFRAMRRTTLDYIEVQSESEALDALIRLRANPSLYRDMVANGLERSVAFSTESLIAQWCEFFDSTLTESLASWQKRAAARRFARQLGSIIRYFSKPLHLKSLLTAIRT